MPTAHQASIVAAPLGIWRERRGLFEVWLLPLSDIVRGTSDSLLHEPFWQESLLLVDLRAAYSPSSPKASPPPRLPKKSTPSTRPSKTTKAIGSTAATAPGSIPAATAATTAPGSIPAATAAPEDTAAEDADETSTPQSLSVQDLDLARLFDLATSRFPAEVSEERQNLHKRLLGAWDRLASVDTLDEGDKDALWLLLRYTTLPSLAALSSIPRLERERLEKPQPFQATAAHPRAYRGTLERPLPSKASPPRDLRLCLLDPRATESIRSQIFSACPLPLGPTRDKKPSAAAYPRLSPSLAPLASPSLPELWRLVAPFFSPEGRLVFSHLCEDSPSEIPSLLLPLTRLWIETPPHEALFWSEHLLLLPAKQRLPWLAALLSLGAIFRSPSDEERPAFTAAVLQIEETLASLPQPAESYETRSRPFLRWFLLLAWKLGFGLPSIQTMLSWAALFRIFPRRIEGYPSNDVSDRHLTPLFLELASGCEGFYTNFILGLWSEIGAFPGLDQTIGLLRSKTSDLDLLFCILQWLRPYDTEDETQDEVTAFWLWLRPRLPRMLDDALALPPDARKRLCKRFETFQDDRLSSHRRRELWEDLWSLSLQRAQDTDLPDAGATLLYVTLLRRLPQAERQIVLSSPQASFHRFERACESHNHAALYRRGLRALAKRFPSLLASAWRDAPASLLRLAFLVGCISPEYASALLSRLCEDPWFADSPTDTSFPFLFRAFQRAKRLAFPAFFPRKFRLAYLACDPAFSASAVSASAVSTSAVSTSSVSASAVSASAVSASAVSASAVSTSAVSASAVESCDSKPSEGSGPPPRPSFTPGQIERLRRLLLDRWIDLRLWRLEGYVKDAIESGFQTQDAPPTEPEAWEYTLLLRLSMVENRKPLNKFLRSWLRGDKEYILRHPRSQEWLKKHPSLKLDAWLQGDLLSSSLEPYGEIRISIETNPFEILRIGSYFKTCLGLGGINDHSSTAVLVDINKQVLFARDRKGRPIARQIVAISEDTQLVVFRPYSHLSPPDDQPLFRLFAQADHLLAERLQIPLYDFTIPEFYKIPNVLSCSWYDDGDWDLREWWTPA